MTQPALSAPDPAAIAGALSRRIMGQDEAIREMAVALSKQLAGLQVGNILMIGSSGTGKTTLMRAVEAYLASDPVLTARSAVVRIHANVLGEEAERGRPGEAVLGRLLERAREQLGPTAPVDMLLRRAASGLVFVDEVDKIRSHISGQPNVAGIRAQEALLTLIENEAVPLTLPAWAGGGKVTERLIFNLRDWLRNEDLFDYGMSPQFLSRFDAIVLLNDLSPDELVHIFLDTPDSSYHQTRAYFDSRGIHLALSPSAVRRIAIEAARQPRLGARALREVFRRVIRDYEFDPSHAVSGGSLLIDLPEVERALGAG